MLRNRLAVLLAQKQIKISRMALDTGLSRTTLTALSQNDSKRIDNDTLNTILMYLQMTYYHPLICIHQYPLNLV